jgi:DNA-binding CsgD family transcriptional regulator
MAAKNLAVARLSQLPNTASEDWKCPNCGAYESMGGCKDPTACATALAKVEAEYARELTELFDQGNNQSLPLLMAGFEALDLLNIGLVLTSASGLLLMANRAAEQILANRDGLELSSSGVFRAMKGCSSSLSTILQRVSRATLTAAPKQDDAVVAVHRPSGKRPLTLLLRSVKRLRSDHERGGPSTMVFILDPELPVQAAEAELRQLYGFTSTEARFANMLMEGKTLDDCCDLLQIRRSTGRTHLQHLFEKVGVQRQSELVSILLKSIGLVRTQSQDKGGPSNSSSERLQESLLKMLMSRAGRVTDSL